MADRVFILYRVGNTSASSRASIRLAARLRADRSTQSVSRILIEGPVRRVEQEHAASTQHAVDLGEEGRGIGDVLDHHVRRHEVEGAGCERQALDVTQYVMPQRRV